MHYEVEQKFVLTDPAAMAAKLSALGAKAAGECNQVDGYYSHPARDFSKTDEALRIRRVDGQALVTYKGPKIDRETKTRREIELALPAGATTAEDFGGLFEALGFAPVAEVRKHRRTFHLAWHGYQVEAALDEVAGLGHFAELEISASEETVDAARRALVDLAARLELGKSERRSYLELLLERPGSVRPPDGVSCQAAYGVSCQAAFWLSPSSAGKERVWSEALRWTMVRVG